MAPDKHVVAVYAATASLAAITLVYVFGPTFFFDSQQGAVDSKKGVVGLSNPANDCFVHRPPALRAPVKLTLFRSTRSCRPLPASMIFAHTLPSERVP